MDGVVNDVLVDDWPCVAAHVEYCDVVGVGDGDTVISISQAIALVAVGVVVGVCDGV